MNVTLSGPLRQAPTGKVRVIGVDTFDHTDWVAGDFDTLKEATAYMRTSTKGKSMLKMHAYNDRGQWLAEAGTF